MKITPRVLRYHQPCAYLLTQRTASALGIGAQFLTQCRGQSNRDAFEVATLAVGRVDGGV
jgi:hypothetical protein